jgi:hypothetical protein
VERGKNKEKQFSFKIHFEQPALIAYFARPNASPKDFILAGNHPGGQPQIIF